MIFKFLINLKKLKNLNIMDMNLCINNNKNLNKDLKVMFNNINQNNNNKDLKNSLENLKKNNLLIKQI